MFFFPAALTAFQASWPRREGADALKSSNSFSLGPSQCRRNSNESN